MGSKAVILRSGLNEGAEDSGGVGVVSDIDPGDCEVEVAFLN